MRAGGCTLQQTLTAEAATVVKHAVGLARQRGHAQTTPLHVAATLLASDTSLLRRACMQSHPHSTSHPLQCKALELCFNVALNRLPASVHGQPSLSNALMAALKRAQAHQRRGCVEQQQQPLLAVKVEMEQLILSILDDPSVSRVMREAGFYSTNVKTNVEEITTSAVSSDSRQSAVMIRSFPVCSPQQIGLKRGNIINFCAPPSLALQQNFSTDDQYLLRVNNPGLQVAATSEILKPPASLRKDVGSVIKALLTTQKRRINTVIVGEDMVYTETVIRELIGRIEAGDVPETLKAVKFIIPQFSSLSFRLLNRDDVEHKVGELRRIIKSCMQVGGRGAIIYVGDLRWAVMDQNDQRSVTEAPNQHHYYSSAEHVTMELGRILMSCHAENQQVWLMATATYQTYMRCNLRKPSLETLWGALHPVTVPLGSLSLALHTSATIDEVMNMEEGQALLSNPEEFDKSKTANSDADDLGKLNCCSECSAKFDVETARAFVGQQNSFTTSSETQRTSALPYWLQRCKNDNTSRLDLSDQATVSSEIRVGDLRRKWNQQCRGIHPHESQSQRDQTEIQMQLDVSSSSSRISSCWSIDRNHNAMPGDPQAQHAPVISGNYSTLNNYQEPHKKTNFFTWGCGAPQSQLWPTPESRINWSVIRENSTRNCFTDPSVWSDVQVEYGSGNSTENYNSRHQQEMMNNNIPTSLIQDPKDFRLNAETTLALGRSSSSDRELTLSNKVPNAAGHEEYCSELRMCHIDPNSPDSMSISVSSYNFGRNQSAEKFNGNLGKSEQESVNFLCRGLEQKVKWQSRIIHSIATTVLKCRSGVGRRLIRGDNLNPGINATTWLLFLGSDWIGKRKIAKALAEIVFGSEDKLICIGLCREYINPNYNHGTNFDERSTYLENFTEAVRLNPHSVVLLEEIDRADSNFKATLSYAMDRGRLIDSMGNEVILSDTIIIMTSTNTGSKYLEASYSGSDGLSAARKTGMKFLVVGEGKAESKNDSAEERQPLLCSRKRKAEWDAQEISRKISDKRKHESSSLDLNRSAEENELEFENYRSTTDNGTDVEAADQQALMGKFSKEFLKFIDKTVVFRPFDFNQIAQCVLDRMNSSFSRATGGKLGSLEIDGAVLDYLATASSWYYSLNQNHVFEKWMDDVFENSLAKPMLSLHQITANTVIRLVANEVDHDDYIMDPLALPTKIDVVCTNP